MKRMNFKRKLFSYIFIWSVIIGSLLSYSPVTHVLSATGVPEISLDSPVEKSVFDVTKVEFTGRISDDLTTPDKLLLNVFEYDGDSAQPVDITSEGQLSITPKDQYAEFSFSKDFSEGDHKLSFIVTDGDGFSSQLEQSFTVQVSANTEITTNPSAVSNELATPQTTSNGEVVQSNTSANTEISVTSLANEVGNRPFLASIYLIPRGTEGNYNPEGKVPDNYLPAEDMTRVPLDYIVLLDIRSTEPFSPTQSLISFFGDVTGKEKLISSKDLADGKKFYLYTYTPDNAQLDPAQSYSIYLNPNELLPRFLTFTTVSTNYENYQFEGDKGNEVRGHDYIHGPFSVVTNACSFCHSPHNGNNEFLEEDKTGQNGDSLCMACHDGTNGSPSIDSNYEKSKHHSNAGASCTSCHDPHNPGTKENPNSFYTSPYNGITKVLAYKKASDATGAPEDFSQCLSCHRSGVTNIERYYKDPMLLSQSGHNITATVDSGSSLNGQLPCAECHETHGSSNLNMLREDLGNVKITDDTKKFKSSGLQWDALNERQFCLKCHNNSTQLYGKTSKWNVTNALNEPITGHQSGDTQGCSSCHGGASKSFMEAAHAPMKITPATPTTSP